MDIPYPPTPPGIPSDLVRPPASYHRGVAIAFLALLAFLGVYLGLMVWFAYKTVVLYKVGQGGEALAFIGMLPAIFFFAFLAKGIFFIRKTGPDAENEVQRKDEPALFAFIERLADELGAPRPRRIILSPRVNAAVFYDVSFWNLLIPTHKNLEIGLGLVNVLRLDEFKAVLAHEFGHFNQRSMAVGTWVYTGGRAIGAIVAHRDGFDQFLEVLSRVDIRVAWIGWLLRLIVWAIRAVLDSCFRLLILAERALSREMEFQADRVAASVTGSDSLVHALKRLGPADDALDRAIGFTVAESQSGRRVRDLFTIQSETIKYLGRVFGDPGYGEIPEPPEGGRAAQRLFSPEIAEAPKMWSSHPPNHEREARSKERYAASIVDERSSWCLFRDPTATREQWTERLLSKLCPESIEKPAVTTEASLIELERLWTRPRNEPVHRGLYVGRSVVLGEPDADRLADPAPADLRAALDSLYPESLTETLKAWKSAEQNAARLKALKEGILQAPGGIIRYQGRDIRRSQLGEIVRLAEAERAELREQLAKRDRLIRGVHLAIAEQIGRGWPAYLRGVARALHYFGHAEADLDDAADTLNTTLGVVTADGKVSESEMQVLLSACNAEYTSLRDIFENASKIALPADALARLRVSSWEDALEPFRLQVPSRENLANNWFSAAATWVRLASSSLGAAESACLDSLITAEARLRRAFLEGEEPGDAPPPPSTLDRYKVFVPGSERRPPQLGMWDRFQMADGVGPGALRAGMASLILAPVLILGGRVGQMHVIVYNGLDRRVDVVLGEQRVLLLPGGQERLTLSPDGLLPVEATADGELIESFQADASDPGAKYVYNVAQAEAFVELWANYGNNKEREPKPLGAQRWFESDLSYVGVDPPKSIDSNHPEYRSYLGRGAPMGANIASSLAGEDAEAIVRAHVQWEPSNSPALSEWAKAGGSVNPALLPVIEERIAKEGKNVSLGRIRQTLAGPTACKEDTAASAASPDDPDLLYLSLRCQEPLTPGSWSAALARFPDHPWLRWGSAYEAALLRQWARASELLDGSPPELGQEGLFFRLRVMRMNGASLDEQKELLKHARDGQDYARLLVAEAQPEKLKILVDDSANSELYRSAGMYEEYGRLVGQDPYALWAIACADGVDPKWKAEAVKAGAPHPGGFPHLCFLATSADHWTQPEEMQKLNAALEGVPEAFSLAIKAPRGKVQEVVDQQAKQMDDVAGRAFLYALGIARLGDAAPRSWRQEAIGVLLPWERWVIREKVAVLPVKKG